MPVPLRAVVALLIVALAAGCASVPFPAADNLVSTSQRIRTCAEWFRDLDLETERAGVADAAAYRVPGFPYLRATRFLASFRREAASDEPGFQAWIQRLRGVDASARRVELRNLPGASLTGLGMADAVQAIERSETCAAELSRQDMADPSRRAQLVERARVPDDYSTWQRALGLYPLVRIPFALGVERWHEEAVELFRQSREGAHPARALVRYAPATPPASPAGIGEILHRSTPDALGIPRVSSADRDRLLAAYAPVFEIAADGPGDRIGALVLSESPIPEVDGTAPTVYGRVAYTRYGGATLWQLVYTIWFPERPLDDAFDLLGGRLDGVVLRVTLASDGAPVVYDSIHPCGCFHMFFPTARARLKSAPGDGDEWAFVPVLLPPMAPGARVAVRLASRTHYLVNIVPALDGGRAVTYALADENILRSLALPQGGYRSIYGPDGLVAGTERGERFLFWPMGIASAGAMRQWGRHATAFLGRRHFDDADLIERRFTVAPR